MTRPTAIDLIYGLEPVFEPGESAGKDGFEPFADVNCPYCGEIFSTKLDLSAGSQTYVEDCQVCCQPIQISMQMEEGGSLSDVTVTADRMDT